jgi:hypothetical protein
MPLLLGQSLPALGRKANGRLMNKLHRWQKALAVCIIANVIHEPRSVQCEAGLDAAPRGENWDGGRTADGRSLAVGVLCGVERRWVYITVLAVNQLRVKATWPNYLLFAGALGMSLWLTTRAFQSRAGNKGGA